MKRIANLGGKILQSVVATAAELFPRWVHETGNSLLLGKLPNSGKFPQKLVSFFFLLSFKDNLKLKAERQKFAIFFFFLGGGEIGGESEIILA